MKAVGIVVEYNPFHNGHLHHVEQAKEASGAEVAVAVMSGNFLQRGEPAFTDKWTRAEMALASGVDLVFELPYRFATAHAPVFSEGAIRLLDAAKCDSFCFGSEEGSIAPFAAAMELIGRSEEMYQSAVREAVKSGVSYPKALNEAYHSILEGGPTEKGLVDLSMPNNILGFHYMEAASAIGSQMRPLTIQRISANYHDDAVPGSKIASATGIRKSFFEESRLDAVAGYIPQATERLLKDWQEERKCFGSWDLFYPLLRYILVREDPKQLAEIADVTEGIENAFRRSALSAETFQAFMGQVKSKRYTWTRLQRMLTHILTGFTKEMQAATVNPSYLRLLGMTDKGRSYLSIHKKSMKLPVISKVSASDDPSLSVDCRASDIFSLGIGRNDGIAHMGLDFKRPPILL